MIEITLLIKIFLLSWVLVRFEPIQWFIELLPNNIIKYTVVLLTSCLKCSNFWIGFLLSGDIFIGAGMSFFGMLYEKTLGKWETKIEFN